MSERVIIADISSVRIEDHHFGHYGKIAKMYQNIFSDHSDFYIAGGPIYTKTFNDEHVIKLPYDHTLDNLNGKYGKIKFKVHGILNGIKLFRKNKDATIVCQPYSFMSWMFSILFASKKTKIFLIEYRNELDKRINRSLYRIVKHKISGILCPNDQLGEQFGLPYITVPDYVCFDLPKFDPNKQFNYDFGMVGIMSAGKDIDDVISTFSDTDYKIVIAGYFRDPDRYERFIRKKTDNITIINKYLSNEEYNSILDETKYMLLPYTENYQNASSGVIYDVLFHGKPVITKNFSNFRFVSEYDIGVLYQKSLQEVEAKRILDDRYYTKLQERICEYLSENQKAITRIRDFITKKEV